MLLPIVYSVLAAFIAAQSDSNRSLSAEIAGKYCIKSSEGTYLQAEYGIFDYVVFSPEEKEESCDHWHIEDRGNDKVVLKADSSGEYLSVTVAQYWRKSPFTSVALLPEWWSSAHFLWTPRKNADGSWSFKTDANGEEWLSAQSKNVKLHTKVGWGERFWLKPKTEKNRRSSRIPEKNRRSSRMKFSKDVSRKYCIKSIHNTFLRASKDGSNDEWKVEMVSPGDACQYWNIEVQKGQVSLEANGTGKFLRANYDGTVDLVDEASGEELWSAFEHFDRSWSFKRERCGWLRASADGRVSSIESDRSAEEQFRLVEWTEPTHVTTSTLPPSTASTTVLPLITSTEASQHDDTTANNEFRNFTVDLIVAVLIFISILVTSVLIYSIFRIRRETTKMAGATNELVVRENLVEKNDEQPDK